MSLLGHKCFCVSHFALFSIEDSAAFILTLLTIMHCVYGGSCGEPKTLFYLVGHLIQVTAMNSMGQIVSSRNCYSEIYAVNNCVFGLSSFWDEGKKLVKALYVKERMAQIFGEQKTVAETVSNSLGSTFSFFHIGLEPCIYLNGISQPPC